MSESLKLIASPSEENAVFWTAAVKIIKHIYPDSTNHVPGEFNLTSVETPSIALSFQEKGRDLYGIVGFKEDRIRSIKIYEKQVSNVVAARHLTHAEQAFGIAPLTA